MVKNNNKYEIPDIILEAYSILLQHRIIEITKPLDLSLRNDKNDCEFECIVEVPYPNLENIPHQVPLRALILKEFPWGPVNFYPKCEEVSGFPHQDAETGKLCLPEERLAPIDAQRLVCYVQWAIEWLKDAANGALLKRGDPYELPDFSRKSIGNSLLTKYALIFNESTQTYEKWKSYIGKSGSAECAICSVDRTIFASCFRGENGLAINESIFSSPVIDQNHTIYGKWLILKDVRYKRYRPPQTYGELEELCLASDLNLYDILKKVWEKGDKSLEIGLILVGFPISRIVGEDPIEIHWQPLLIENLEADYKSGNHKGKSGKPRAIWPKLTQNKGRFSRCEQLYWGMADNVAQERMYARGAYSSKVRSCHVAIFGCGALGCLVAEFLSRGGVSVINLFDTDNVKFGNLCRHTLDGMYLGKNKALSLAKRLSSANPLSEIHGYSDSIPLKSSSSRKICEAIDKSDLLIDCTASEVAFDWLDSYSKKQNKRMVSMFINFHAEMLTLCISGATTSCNKVFQDLQSCICSGQASIDPGSYFYQPSKEEQIIEGPGCWHPTFPALNAHIQMLTASAIDVFGSHIEKAGVNGLAAIIRRNSPAKNEIQTGSIVEIIWSKVYP